MVSPVLDTARMKYLDACRACGGPLEDIYHYRSVALANAYRSSPAETPTLYPLHLAACGVCGLAQIRQEIDRDLLYANYTYIPSTSTTMLQHFDDLATSYAREGMKVTDIGSNDGTLLKAFQRLGCDVLGVEPAANMAALAESDGIPTVNSFFDASVQISGNDLITATNVIANTTDLAGFLTAVHDSLGDGQFVCETPDFERLIARGAYDAVYHEHMCYFTPVTLKNTLERYGLVVERLEHVLVHGGSMRATCRKGAPVSREAMIDYGWFVQQAKFRAEKVWEKLRDQKETVGYGAPAKATVLLSEAEIRSDQFAYIVDSIPFKQGKWMPGLDIEIKPEVQLGEPARIFVLAWNFEQEIAAKIGETIAEVVSA